jgi:hypothetical protein
MFGEEYRNLYHAVLSSSSSYFTFLTSNYSHCSSVVKHHKSIISPSNCFMNREGILNEMDSLDEKSRRLHALTECDRIVEFTSRNERLWMFYTKTFLESYFFLIVLLQILLLGF